MTLRPPVLVAAVLCITGTAAAQSLDALGDPLPEGAVQRLGSLRLRSIAPADICYLADGRAALALGREIEIWDLSSLTREGAWTVSESSLVRLSLRPDGGALLVTDGAGWVHEWDVANHDVLRSFDTGQRGLTTAHYSPDGTRALTTGSQPCTIKEWDLATGEELIAIEGEMHSFHEAIYGPAGTSAIATGPNGSDEVLAHYDLRTGELMGTWLKDYYTHAKSIALSADGERLLVGSRTRATEWRLEGYELLRTFTGHSGGAVTSVAYCANPDELLTGSRDGSIRRWNRHSGEVLLRWFVHDGHVTRLLLSPDGERVLSYGAGAVVETSVQTGEQTVTLPRHGGPVEAVAAFPEGSRVVSGSRDETLRIWDALSGETLAVLGGARMGAYAVAISPDGARVAAGGKDSVVREWELASGELLRELPGHFGYVRALAYTPAGDHLLSSADDATVRVWGAGEEPERILRGHRGGVLALAISADGSRVLTGGRDGTVRLFDLSSGELLGTFMGHRSWVQAVRFLGEGATEALTGSADGRILRWDLATGEVLAEMVQGEAVRTFVVSADADLICAAGTSGRVVVWDLADGSRVRELTGHRAAVTGLALTGDGRHVVSASADTTLLVWALPAR
ncbi:MAG: WD40 repeat domain-containing protein [Armatimonadota bacterium]